MTLGKIGLGFFKRRDKMVVTEEEKEKLGPIRKKVLEKMGEEKYETAVNTGALGTPILLFPIGVVLNRATGNTAGPLGILKTDENDDMRGPLGYPYPIANRIGKKLHEGLG